MVVAKLVKHLNLLKDNEAIGNKLYHSVKLTDSSAPRFHDHVVVFHYAILINTLQLAYKLSL